MIAEVSVKPKAQTRHSHIRIAIDFGLTYPQRVTALVLCAPAISGVGVYPPEIQARLETLEVAEQVDDFSKPTLH